MRQTELDPQDDRVSIFGFQALQRGVVSLQGLGSNRLLERRWIRCRTLPVEWIGGRVTLGATDFVADPVEQGLAEVGLERAFMTWFERREALNDLRERVLNQILRVERPAGPRGETTVRPPLEPWEIPRAQLIKGGGVARLGPRHQEVRRLRIALWISGGTHRA
jgi:hypothetical protein